MMRIGSIMMNNVNDEESIIDCDQHNEEMINFCGQHGV
jgi:hypothetical protein